ncbi:hypothetical protein [Halobaculum gomorrense]|uniref:Uncharacterized protein n=1 Tax=Halobaculum gomorrense TaxID=43928 RepID=A0A1M5PEL1_9EURY|nr:hypothetical protein [Halobaculum gomorrense]SHH00148.1 hypothetical protein SAMN05443636_1568 [Halobaculum gomorrense]
MNRTTAESSDETDMDLYLPATPNLESAARVEAVLRRLLRRRGALRRVVRPKY